MFVRIYTGADGQSHFEELDLEKGPVEWSKMETATGAVFKSFDPGYFMDWHCAPKRQYVITLSGRMEIKIGDGAAEQFGPGDVLLADDLTGQGHTTRVMGDEPRVTVTIPLD